MKRIMYPNPQGQWVFSASNSASISQARMRELFWSAPETSEFLEEAEHALLLCSASFSLPNRCNSSMTFMKTWLAECSSGRKLLHLACLLRDGNVRWHLAGMKREFQRLAPRRSAAPTLA